MSSGELRVFRIIDAVYSAPKYALILIDEIDLFLHQDALVRMLANLHQHCKEKNKQLVFTTHSPSVAELSDLVSIWSIHSATSKTVVWAGYSHEALRLITGKQSRPISIYVEDDVAEAIASQVAGDLGLRKFVEIGRFGPASNAFSLSAGLLLSGAAMDDVLILLDGDVQASKTIRRESIKKALSGSLVEHKEKRKSALAIVRRLHPRGGKSPEQTLHHMLQLLDESKFSSGDSALLKIVSTVINVPERHGFINQVILDSGEHRAVALSKLVGIASKSDLWPSYTRLLRSWLLIRGKKLALC